MKKNFYLKYLSKIHLYHHYIDYKYFFRNILIKIIGEIKIFNFLYLKTRKLDLVINRKYFGESIYEYVNALSNIKKYLQSNFNNKNPKTYLSNINVFFSSKKINTLLDDWFNLNLQILLKEGRNPDNQF